MFTDQKFNIVKISILYSYLQISRNLPKTHQYFLFRNTTIGPKIHNIQRFLVANLDKDTRCTLCPEF